MKSVRMRRMTWLGALVVVWFHFLAAGQDGAGEARWREIFEKADQNSDGKVSSKELENKGRRGNWIARADEDGDGLATWEETQRFLQMSLGISKNGEQGEKPQVLHGDWKPDARVSLSSVKAAAEYSADQGGHSFLLMIDGEIVFERYEPGRTPEDPHRLASGTKSFSGVILAAAVQDGLLTLDEKISKTLPEWKDDELLSRITFRQLLSLTSGIDPGRGGKVPSYRESVETAAVSGPGERFRYGPQAFQVFGEVMRRKLEASPEIEATDPLRYLESRVLEPVGMKVSSWRRDSDGMPQLPSGAFLTAREWAKFGEFLRNEGKWEGTQLIDRETLRECLKGTKAKSTYGLTFWLLEQPRKAGVPVWGRGGYMAAGAGKQRLYVLPEKGIVVARQGESVRFENEKFLGLLLGTSQEIRKEKSLRGSDGF